MRTYKGIKQNKDLQSRVKSSNNNSVIVPGTSSSLKQKNYCSPYILVNDTPKYQGSLLAKRILEYN